MLFRSLLAPRGIAEWAREHPAMPPPPSKPGTEIKGVLEFEHWRRRERAREDRGKGPETRSPVKSVGGPEPGEAGPSGETDSPRKRRSTAGAGKDMPPSPVRRSQRNKEVTVVEAEVRVKVRPPTPAPTSAAARSKLSEGAILRCIPVVRSLGPLYSTTVLNSRQAAALQIGRAHV